MSVRVGGAPATESDEQAAIDSGTTHEGESGHTVSGEKFQHQNYSNFTSLRDRLFVEFFRSMKLIE